MRTFIAIALPTTVQGAIQQQQRRCKAPFSSDSNSLKQR